MMILFIIIAINITSDILQTKLIEEAKQIYISEHEGATMEMADQALLNEYSPATQDVIWKYNSYDLIFQIIIMVLTITMFMWIILKKVHSELHSFETALDSISDVEVEDWEVLTINSDIKEFDSICHSYNRMVERLQKSEQSRSRLEGQRRQMTADISHDLKTPITVIRGYAKALSDGVTDEEAQQKYLDAIYTKTEMVAELIDTFHEYSKLDHPQFGFEMKEGNLCEYFREYLAMKYEELDLAGFELEAELPDEPIIFTFDHQQFKRVFENLITNSFRHNKAGTTIFASITDDRNAVVIHIGDNGKGIPKELRETIFEPFVVGSRSRTANKGSGLGLAISKRIVEAHGGVISLIDDPAGIQKTLYEIVLKKPAEKAEE